MTLHSQWKISKNNTGNNVEYCLLKTNHEQEKEFLKHYPSWNNAYSGTTINTHTLYIIQYMDSIVCRTLIISTLSRV